LRIASIRRWPILIRRTLLLVGFLTIGSYINFEILDVDGSRLTKPFIAAWTDFEASSDQAEQIIQALISARGPLPTDWSTCSAWAPSRPGLPIQSRIRRIVSGASRTPGATRTTSPSADPV
jgi:hypothetical protein